MASTPRFPDDAACRGLPFDLFAPWPDSHSPAQQDPDLAAGAKRVCRTCPVVLACLGDGCEDVVSVRGGLTPHERRRRQMRRAG